MNLLATVSLYGNISLFNDGLLEVVPLFKQYFPEWRFLAYIDENAPALEPFLKLTKEDPLLECVVMPDFRSRGGGNIGMFDRFLAFADPDAEYIACMDVDDRPCHKKRVCLDEWIKAGTLCWKALEGENQAGLNLMGCAFGLKGGLFPNIEQDIKNWIESFDGYEIDWRKKRMGCQGTRLRYGSDQEYLFDRVWPVVKHSVLTHGYNATPFPPHEPPPWGELMYQRIVPGTNNLVVAGERAKIAYDLEDN